MNLLWFSWQIVETMYLNHQEITGNIKNLIILVDSCCSNVAYEIWWKFGGVVSQRKERWIGHDG